MSRNIHHHSASWIHSLLAAFPFKLYNPKFKTDAIFTKHFQMINICCIMKQLVAVKEINVISGKPGSLSQMHQHDLFRPELKLVLSVI